jgi:hypothetical protein
MARAMVVRPFGVKQGIDFDVIERRLVSPALAASGLSGSTTAQIAESGNLREDTLLLLLRADVAIVDVSIDHGDVFYQLGVRHALCARPTLLIRSASERAPFDLLTARLLVYDARNPEASVPALAEAIREALASPLIDSPIFLSLPLLEPPRVDQLTAVPQSFREAVQDAATTRRPGNLWLLAHEISHVDWAVEGLRIIGQALFDQGAYRAGQEALEALRLRAPDDTQANLLLSTVYQRLGDMPRSNVALDRVLASATRPGDRAEALALRARNAKAAWRNQFESLPLGDARIVALKSVHLADARDRYLEAFEGDQQHYYSGLSALALQRIQTDLAQSLPEVWAEQFDSDLEADSERFAGEARLAQLGAAVQFSLRAARSALERSPAIRETDRMWLDISEADHAFLTASRPRGVVRRYIQALRGAQSFAVHSARQQLELFDRLGVRSELTREVLAALGSVAPVLPDEGRDVTPAFAPTRVLLFVGHQVDAPGRPTPRFPAAAEPHARELIRRALEREIAGAGDRVLAIASGGPGGDILFHEVCAELGIQSRLFLPVPPREFGMASVQYAGAAWLERYNRLCERLRPEVLGESGELPPWLRTRPGYSVWQRVAPWMLFNALSLGTSSVSLIALWDGRPSDGPGGVSDLVTMVGERGLELRVLDAADLAGFAPAEPPPVERASAELPPLPPLRPSADLIDAFTKRLVVPVVGAGFSAQAGLPVWRALYASLVRVAATQSVVDLKTAETLERGLNQGQYDDVADRLVHALSRSQLASGLQQTLAIPDVQPSAAHRLLSDLPLGPVLTFNLDDLLERSLQFPKDRVYTRLTSERALDSLSRGERFLQRLSGSLDAPDSLLLSVGQHIEEASANKPLKELIDRLAVGRTFLFIGLSAEGVSGFMRAFQLRARPGQSHVAIVRAEDTTWELAALNLRDRYGVETLPFAEATEDTALVDFLTVLRTETRASAATAATIAPPLSSMPAKLKALTLDNIGPFDRLTLEFDPHWNCLLGNNGVGKSTILKALGVALGGDDVATYAERIVRRGKRRAEILLTTTHDKTYRTVVEQRTGGGVDISRPDGTPEPAWLALGFPALRTTTWEPVLREGLTIASRPGTHDLKPLLADEPDPRLDALKQRIVALDHWVRQQERTPDAIRYEELVRTFFEKAGTLASGVGIDGYTVDPLAGRVLVKSRNSRLPIPMESLSQGTISLTSLVGVLLQRLYDVSSGGESPMTRYALALVDEIDAHMHPKWQRSITMELSRHFPNVQFIVTTHSPLVVGGMNTDQVYLLRRNDDGAVMVDRPEQSLQGLGVAGLLTSELFDLDTHLDVKTERDLARKRELQAMETRHQADEEELAQLDDRLGNVDYTRIARDPLYVRFVKAMTRAEAAAPAREPGTPLTEEERRRKDQIADEILGTLLAEEEAER